jgi:hypothetical protein
MRLTAADLDVRHDNARKMSERAGRILRKFDPRQPEEQGFTLRHAKRAETVHVPLLVDALVLARRMGCGWYCTRDNPDKHGRCDVPMSWCPTYIGFGYIGDENGYIDRFAGARRAKSWYRRNKAHDF